MGKVKLVEKQIISETEFAFSHLFQLDSWNEICTKGLHE